MDMSLYMELEHLRIRLDGITGFGLVLSDAVENWAFSHESYTDAITLMYFLLRE